MELIGSVAEREVELMRATTTAIPRRRLVRAVTAALGLVAVAALATPSAGLAAGLVQRPPAVGQNCQADGHISGAGSTFQTNLMNDGLIYGFEQDVCGPVANASKLESQSLAGFGSWSYDPSAFTGTYKGVSTPVNGMIAYNYDLGGVAAIDGSGAALERISCRTEEFVGTDLPYNSAQFGAIDSAPGFETGGSAPRYNCDNPANLNLAAVPPPFQPLPPGTAANTPNWPNAGDGTPTQVLAGVMTIPVAGGAEALAVNLNGVCTNGTPTGLDLTSSEADQIFQGTINEWNDPQLLATDPSLGTDGCSGPITRIVRSDAAGETTMTMFWLDNIDASPLCGSGSGTTWGAIATSGSNYGQWPTGCTAPGTGSVAQGPETASGSQGLISLLSTNVMPVWNAGCDLGAGCYTTVGGEGGISYAEVGLWPSLLPPGVSFVNLQNAAGTAFESPGAPGAASTCGISPSTPGLPAPGNFQTAVGLGTDNWADDQVGTNNKVDLAATEAGYPVCGLTFDVMWTGMDNETGETASPSPSTATAGCTLPTPSTNVIGTQSVPLSGNSLTVSSTADFPSSGAITVQDGNGTTETLTYAGKTATSLAGIPAQGSPGGPLPTASSFSDDVAVSFVYGGVTDLAQTLPETTLTMTSTAGLPTAGTLAVAGNTLAYTGKTAASLTGVSGGSGAVPAGSAVGLMSTTAAASSPTSTGEPVPVSPGVMGQCQTVHGPEIGTTDDQLRTLYSFFTYAFSPLGQSYLAPATYDPLPSVWLQEIIVGYQEHF
jgi:ABC-type phosphate transport system substrate-binding protein